MITLVFAEISAAAKQGPSCEDRETDEPDEGGYDGVCGDPGSRLDAAPAHLGTLVCVSDLLSAVDDPVTNEVTAHAGA